MRRVKAYPLIWKYFVRKSNTKTAICNTCNKTISFKTNMTNLKQHLRQMHPDVYEDMLLISSSNSMALPVASHVEIGSTDEISHQGSAPKHDDNENEDIGGGNAMSPSSEGTPRQSTAVLWDYFDRNPLIKLAVCKSCNKSLSYKTTVANLKQHLRSKHVHVYEDMVSKLASDGVVANVSAQENINLKTLSENSAKVVMHAEPEDENSPQLLLVSEHYGGEDTSDGEGTYRKGHSKMWNYFVQNPKTKLAACNFCDKVISYKTTTTNLKQHLRRKHVRAYEDVIQKKSSDAAVASIMNSIDEKSRLSSGSESGDEEDNAKMVRRKTTTIMWKHFVKNEETKSAVCNICNSTISYKTTLTNLKSHLRLQHVRQYEDMILKANRAVTLAETEAENSCQLPETESGETTSDGKISRGEALLIISNYYFLNPKTRMGVCKVCDKTISYRTTITNLKSHLRKAHVREHEDMILKLCSANEGAEIHTEYEALDESSRQSWSSAEHGGDEDDSDGNSFYIVSAASLDEHFISEVNDIVIQKKKESAKTTPKKWHIQISEPQKDQRCTIKKLSPSTVNYAGATNRNDDENAGTAKTVVSSYVNDDEYTAIGITVEVKLRNMQYEQRLYAENLINQALYKGSLFQLTEHSTIVNMSEGVTKSDGDECDSNNKKKTSAGSKRPAFVSVEAKKRKRSMEGQTFEEEMDLDNMITEEVHDILLKIKKRDTDSSD